MSPLFLQACAVLDEADISQHAKALTERFAAAQAAVATIPEHPVTSSFLAVETAPATEDLLKTIAGLLGALTVGRVVEVGRVLLCLTVVSRCVCRMSRS